MKSPDCGTYVGRLDDNSLVLTSTAFLITLFRRQSAVTSLEKCVTPRSLPYCSWRRLQRAKRCVPNMNVLVPAFCLRERPIHLQLPAPEAAPLHRTSILRDCSATLLHRASGDLLPLQTLRDCSATSLFRQSEDLHPLRSPIRQFRLTHTILTRQGQLI